MLVDRDTIFINGSSTALLMYQYIEKNVVIITNNAQALFIPRNPSVNFILVGGEASSHNGNYIMTGEFATDMISNITATKCILGVSGISVDGGLTSFSIQDSPINKMMIAQCHRERIVIADSSKVGIKYNFRSAQIHKITHLVTDDRTDEIEVERIRRDCAIY